MKNFMWILVFFCFFLASCNEKVEYTLVGDPICPYCKVTVEPHSEYCKNCKNNFRYSNDVRRCYACNGSKNCPACRGSGKLFDVEGARQKCDFCAGTGVCPQCDDGAYIEHGNSALKGDLNRAWGSN